MATRDDSQHKALIIVFSLLFGVLAVLSAYAAMERSAGVHLPVIAAGAVLLALAIISQIRYSWKTVGVFVFSAAAVGYALYGHLETTPDNLSGTIAVVFAILYTGLFGLLLLSRTETKPSRPVKVVVMTAALTLCVAGSAMYMFGLGEGALEHVTMFLLVLSVPMVPLALAAFLVLSASHRSEVTLPSDKWV